MEWAEVIEWLCIQLCEKSNQSARWSYLYQIKTPKTAMGHSLILIPEEQGEKANFTLNKLDHEDVCLGGI